jgi:alkylation response protein AidB-like acyl-CoA dehydrogenase
MGDEQHPLIAAAREIATGLLDPAAADTDLGGVPRSHLDAIGAAGLLGLFAPVAAGGSAVSPKVARGIAELLAGADAATWFVQTQHHSPVRMLAASASTASDRYLAHLANGELIAGVAFSHLRRYPQRRVVEATRLGGPRPGWRLDGVAPWYTGWGLNDVAFLSGIAADGTVVFGVVPAVESPQLRVRARITTSALDAASTVALELDGVTFEDADVAARLSHESWTIADRATNANANPAIFGVARSAVELLALSEEREALECAAVFGDWLADVRARVDALVDDVAPGDCYDERIALRAEALEMVIGVTTALVTAGAGAAMSVRSPAQRKAREALFLLVQAQTAPGRAATLTRWSATARQVSTRKAGGRA